MPKNCKIPLDRRLNSYVGIVLPNVDGLVRECKAIFRSVLQSNSLGFTEYRAVGNRTIYSLTSAEATRAEAKYVYSVVPFITTQRDLYWLASSLEFRFQEGNYHLDSASLLIFQGEANDPRKTALLRAEWACSEADSKAVHAQPHWHIYPSRVNREIDQFQNEFFEEATVQIFEAFPNSENKEEEVSEWDRAERFHFAMAARWHDEGRDAHKQEIQTETLIKWIDGCLRYIQSQFNFLYQ